MTINEAIEMLSTFKYDECELPFPNVEQKAIDSEDLHCMQLANARYLLSIANLAKRFQKIPTHLS